jgi:3-phenylpropionate/trans-cinnamate dioxygenase ferredoxin reductase subunit
LSERIVIIGAGQAGAQAVASLRADGFAGDLVMIGDEAYAPYQRPPLSKTYLMGTLDRERLFLKPDAFYAEARCEVMLNASVERIDRDKKVVTLKDGITVPYDKLLLATGSRVREIKCPGADLPGVFYLRSIADVDKLRPAFETAKNVAVVGGGYIGLEVGAVARKRGLNVTVYEALERVMQRAVSKPISDFYDKTHRDAGVNIMLNTGVEAFEGEGKLQSIRAGGTSYPADIAVVGIGILPNDLLAKDAGLTVGDGIHVDPHCQTSDPNIWAAGDCTRHHGRDGNHIRLECVQNAIDQAKFASLAMMGQPKPYKEVPWFWSDQYDLKLQIAGLAWPTDSLVVRGDPASRKFAVFHLRNGAVAAVEAVNAAPEYIVGRKLIADGTHVAPERLANPDVSMKQVVK